MDSEVTAQAVASTRTKLLSYLGQLKSTEWADMSQLTFKLNLRFTSVKSALKLLELQLIVEKDIQIKNGTRAVYRLSPDYQKDGKPYIAPEWSDAYGKHPHSV